MRHAASPHLRRAPGSRQRGASMIEILVTLLILGFGLMGMSAMQARALQGSVSSFQRGQAVIFAQYMLDVLRIDREAAKGGSYNLTKSCASAGISGSSLATNSLRAWIDTMKEDMGSGNTDTTTCVSVQCDADYRCTVKIFWDDSRAGGLGDQTITVSSRV